MNADLLYMLVFIIIVIIIRTNPYGFVLMMMMMMIIPVSIQSAMMAGQEPRHITLLIYIISSPPSFTLLRRKLDFKDYDQSTPQRHASHMTPLCSW
jgi:hypothetical protein